MIAELQKKINYQRTIIFIKTKIYFKKLNK